MCATPRQARRGRCRKPLLALVAAAAFGACPHASALAAPPASDPVPTADQLEQLVDQNVGRLMARQLPWGGFDDPLAGPRFNYGAVSLAWLSGELAVPGAAGDARRGAAAVTLRQATRVANPGAFEMWLEALVLRPGAGDWLDPETRAALRSHLERFVEPTVGDRARRCHEDPRCYNNLKLVDAGGALQQVRTGLRSTVPGARLASPEATERRARQLLATVIPRVQQPNLRIRAGAVKIDDAAVLSDPSRNPLAYHALSTAMLMRAVRLLGPETPAATRLAARRALWALVGLADPRGEITWMGRGQQLVWPVGATLYASLAGAAEFATREPALAARLRRLAALEYAELTRRAGEFGLSLSPVARSSLAGLDRSTDTIACNGLALAFVHLAAAESGAASGATAPLPAEVPGATTVDPTAAGVATMRAGRVWLAVHRGATHPRDARYDVGLLAALVRTPDGWRPVVGQRPDTDASRYSPSSGPLLLTGGHTLAPSGRLTVRAGQIVLEGAWRGTGRAVPMRWRFAALPNGVRLTMTTPRGAALRLIEWMPASATVTVLGRGIALPGRSVLFSRPVRARRLAGTEASAAAEREIGMQLEARSDGRPLAISWRAR